MIKTISILLLCLCGLLSQAGIFPNVRTVHKDNLYRSAQLSKRQFKKYIEKYGIKTVINLRGKSSSEWYLDEMDAMDETGTEHFDVRMGASRLPHRKDLLRLLELYETAKRPILIHCQGGADRTGEASALYKLEFMGSSKKDAMKMQTIWYRHLKWRYPAKRYFIGEIYQGKQWALDSYRPCEGKYKYYNTESLECN